jgi:hypothetical protein
LNKPDIKRYAHGNWCAQHAALRGWWEAEVAFNRASSFEGHVQKATTNSARPLLLLLLLRLLSVQQPA